MAGSFNTGTTAVAVINDILTQEANRIGSDIYKDTLHTSPWTTLIKQSAFPDSMGYQMQTLIYDRALPLKSGTLASSPIIGLNWNALSANFAANTNSGFSTGQSLDLVGPSGDSGGSASKSTVDFTRRLKAYSLSRAVVESPRLNIEDLRFAAYRTEQLRAIMDLLKEVTRNSWENRYRDEFDKLALNIVLCKSSGTTPDATAANEGKQTWAATGAAASTSKAGDVDAGTDGADIDANISNKILDRIYFQLVRGGAGSKSYGRENGRPVFALIASSEASYALQTEAGFRDDVRYNSSKVSDLIAPLGVEKAFRGFYHLIDDLAPRLSFNGTTDAFERVEPYTVTGGIVIPNPSYESAEFEVAYVMTDEVMEALVPNPLSSGGAGVNFNPINYKGDFKWTNIPDVELNPDGSIGFFRGILASASKPIKTAFGYSIVFKRTTSVPAA